MAVICLLTSEHNPLDDRIFYKEAKTLQRLGHQVHILTGQGWFSETIEGIHIFSFGLGKVPYRFGLRQWFQSLAFVYFALRTGAGVYHCHEPELLVPGLLIKLIRSLLQGQKAALVHEIRDFYLDDAYLDVTLGFWDRINLRIRGWWDRLLHEGCDALVGVEESKLERYFNRGLRSCRILTIENYVPLELFPAVPKKFDSQHPVIGYAGGLSFARGLDKLARACVLLSDRLNVKPTLLVVGSFPVSLREEERQFFDYCREKQNFFHLRYLGWLPHTRVAEAIAQADICCSLYYSKRYAKVLSTRAGPLKLYEYMACAKPIVATAAPALTQTITQAGCGRMVDPQGGENAIAEALEFYCTQPHLLREAGQRGRVYVERYYNWGVAGKKLIALYNDLLKH